MFSIQRFCMSAFGRIASGAVLVMLVDVLAVRVCTLWILERPPFNDYNWFGRSASVYLVTARLITLSWFQSMWILCMSALSAISWGLHFSRFGVGAWCTWWALEWWNLSASTKFWTSAGPGFPAPEHWPQNNKCVYPNKRRLSQPNGT